ncbi:MAG TPA: septal ring lytic transglycosylase RlpA family protein [Myxococcota bacterium]|nr:septal ring lytic transglycosylase RlpA family protein [Myxococcota bacterium]
MLVLLLAGGGPLHAAERCVASHYGVGDGLHGGRVACRGLGPFNTHATSPYTAAHRTAPCGSWLLVTSLRTGQSIRVLVTDRGPFVRGRCIDLGIAGARALGISGVGRVSVVPLTTAGCQP